MKVAALDLGSNTFLCLIAEVNKGQVSQIIDDQVQVVRLGQDVQKTKRFHPEALARAEKTLTEFRKAIDLQKVDKILAVATSAARDVSNKEELLNICRRLEIPIEIISGDREASITYLGAVSHLGGTNNQVVIDIGGGSTELILGKGVHLIRRHSFDLGCVRMTEKWKIRPPTGQLQLDEISSQINEVLNLEWNSLVGSGAKIEKAIAVAGTPTEMARLEIGKFDPEKVEGFQLDIQTLLKWKEIFASHSPEELVSRFQVHPGRADVILVGVMILIEVLDRLKLSAWTVSTRGVRFGVALSLADGGLP